MTELLTLKFFSGAVLWKKKQINKQKKDPFGAKTGLRQYLVRGFFVVVVVVYLKQIKHPP